MSFSQQRMLNVPEHQVVGTHSAKGWGLGKNYDIEIHGVCNIKEAKVSEFKQTHREASESECGTKLICL